MRGEVETSTVCFLLLQQLFERYWLRMALVHRHILRCEMKGEEGKRVKTIIYVTLFSGKGVGTCR